MGNGERINNRQTLSEEAKSLGIDPRGMNASQKREAIAETKAANEAQEVMVNFVKDQLQLDAANNGGGRPQGPQPVPEVKVAPVVESTATTKLTELPVRTGLGGGGGGSTIAVVVVDNGEFKTGNFYIDGQLEAVV